MLKKQGNELSELARQLLRDNSGQLEKMIREAARRVQLANIERAIEENHFARALARQLGLGAARARTRAAARRDATRSRDAGDQGADGGVSSSAG